MSHTTAAMSARNLLGSTGEMGVTVLNAKQVSRFLVVISFRVGKQRYDDLYNISANLVKKILTEGKRVTAILVPDNSDDLDGHPSVISVTVL